MDGSNHKRFVTNRQLADLLGVTRQTNRNWCVKEEIQAFKIGHHLKIPRTEAVRVLRGYHLPVPGWLAFDNEGFWTYGPFASRPSEVFQP